MIKRKTIIIITSLMTSYSCSILNIEQIEDINTNISGYIEFPKNFKIKATSEQVGSQSSIVLMNPDSKNTIVTSGMSDNNGFFYLNPDTNFKPKKNQIFILEASQRLNGASNNNISIRTNILWNGKSFDSITYPKIFINSTTTAISLISHFNKQDLLPINTIKTINNNISQIPNLSTKIDSNKINDVKNLVELSLTAYLDPIAVIKFSDNSYSISIDKKTPLLFGCSGNCDNYYDPMKQVKEYELKETVIPKEIFTEKLLFSSNKIENESDDNLGNISNIYTMNPDSTELVKLTPKEDIYIKVDYDFPISCNNNSKIIYQKSYMTVQNGDYLKKSDFYIMNNDGSNKHILFENIPNFNFSTSEILKNKHVCEKGFITSIFDPETNRNQPIFYNGSDTIFLSKSTNNKNTNLIKISPNEDKISFIEKISDTTYNLNIYDINTNSTRSVSLESIGNINYSWSSDSSKILIYFKNNTYENSISKILLLDPSDLTVREIDGIYQKYSWLKNIDNIKLSKNNEKIVFSSDFKDYNQILTLDLNNNQIDEISKINYPAISLLPSDDENYFIINNLTIIDKKKNKSNNMPYLINDNSIYWLKNN